MIPRRRLDWISRWSIHAAALHRRGHRAGGRRLQPTMCLFSRLSDPFKSPWKSVKTSRQWMACFVFQKHTAVKLRTTSRTLYVFRVNVVVGVVKHFSMWPSVTLPRSEGEFPTGCWTTGQAVLYGVCGDIKPPRIPRSSTFLLSRFPIPFPKMSPETSANCLHGDFKYAARCKVLHICTSPCVKFNVFIFHALWNSNPNESLNNKQRIGY